MTRENYIEKVRFKESLLKKYYTDTVIEKHKEIYLDNFDLNMAYFRSLSKGKFEDSLQEFLNENSSFMEITDLNAVNGTSGYYVMLLDEYAQAYIGTSRNIKKRIQQHWTMQMYFDRMIFGDKDHSILSINSFRALDTTRIFVYPTSNTFNLEDKFINQFDQQYLLNRTAGGILEGLSEAVAKMKTRDFSI